MARPRIRPWRRSSITSLAASRGQPVERSTTLPYWARAIRPVRSGLVPMRFPTTVISPRTSWRGQQAAFLDAAQRDQAVAQQLDWAEDPDLAVSWPSLHGDSMLRDGPVGQGVYSEREGGSACLALTTAGSVFDSSVRSARLSVRIGPSGVLLSRTSKRTAVWNSTTQSSPADTEQLGHRLLMRDHGRMFVVHARYTAV